MKLKYKILDNRIGTEFDIPRYQTAGSAGMDLIACCDESITLSPNESTIIPSGISIFIEDNNFAAIVIPNCPNVQIKIPVFTWYCAIQL